MEDVTDLSAVSLEAAPHVSDTKETQPMNQEERSERSRAQILEAALKLFSHRGYGATSVRDIADDARACRRGTSTIISPTRRRSSASCSTSTFQAMSSPEFPFNRALATGTFPENLEELGRAARETVKDYREYVALIYVDVVEFDGTHIRKFYADMSQRFDTFMKSHGMEDALAGRLQDGLSPISAVMLATRIFYNYFSIEILFGVKDHFGKNTDEVVGEISRILRSGMLKNGHTRKRRGPEALTPPAAGHCEPPQTRNGIRRSFRAFCAVSTREKPSRCAAPAALRSSFCSQRAPLPHKSRKRSTCTSWRCRSRSSTGPAIRYAV